jgi:hypothetical protein
MREILETPTYLLACWTLFWVAVTPILVTVILNLLEGDDT